MHTVPPQVMYGQCRLNNLIKRQERHYNMGSSDLFNFYQLSYVCLKVWCIILVFVNF